MERPRDERTTRGWAQPVGLAFLVVLSIYHLTCFHFALTDKGTPAMWWGTWQMFTTIDKTTQVVEGEAFYEGEWHAFDPQSLFPFEWESGPRYARAGFYDSAPRVKILAESTCRRFERPIEQVRYRVVTWTRRLGTLDRPPNAKSRTLVSWTCGEAKLKLPRGRTL